MNVRDKQWISGLRIYGTGDTRFYISSTVRKKTEQKMMPDVEDCLAPALMILGFLLQVRNLFLKMYLIKAFKSELKTQKLQFQTATSRWRLNVSALGEPTS